MRVRHALPVLPVCLLPFVVPACLPSESPTEKPEPVASAQAALDAPWRTEPVLNPKTGTVSDRAIPIQVPIHDYVHAKMW